MRWSKEEIIEFDQLVEGVGSRDQLTRVESRIRQREFISKHSKTKCDAMFAYLDAGGKKEDFSDELPR